MKINAYVLAGDPAWATASLRSYYSLIDTIVVSFDQDHRSWSGDPLNVTGALQALHDADPAGKIVPLQGHFSNASRPRLELETEQRQMALDRASHDCDWVLQLDTDEILLDQDTFLAQLKRADAHGYDAMHYPLRDYYQAVGSQLYLEHSSRLWRVRANYPGPVAVRAGTQLKHCRQADVLTYRIDFRPRNTDPFHPAKAPVHAVIPQSKAVAHMSWVRTSREMQQKSKVDGHADSRDWSQELRSWQFRKRHPVLTMLTNVMRRNGTRWFRISFSEATRPLGHPTIRDLGSPSKTEGARGPAVDIVLATNRDSPFLVEALRSIRNQTHENWHLIVVDDGSPDFLNLEHLVREHVPEATVYRQVNRGPGAARNAGIRLGSAPLVTFMDDDDVWRPQRLELLLSAMSSHPDAIGAHSSATIVDSQGNPLSSRPAVAGAAKDMLRGVVPIPFFGTVLSTRQAILRAGGFTESVATAEDNGLLLDLLQQGSLVPAEEELLIYRRHAHNLTNAPWPLIRDAGLAMLTEKVDDAAARGDVLVEGLLRENRRRYCRRALTEEMRWFKLQAQGGRVNGMARSVKHLASIGALAYLDTPGQHFVRALRYMARR